MEKLEAQLPLIFQRADKWNAVLLLDEADVFLEQSCLHDVHRNVLVYAGIELSRLPVEVMAE